MTTTHIKVSVNGEAREADVEPRLLLVHLLRDTFGLTGTHVGCDTSNCGACTIHVNGDSAKSCTMLAAMAEGHEVSTVEGMEREVLEGGRATIDRLQPVMFVENTISATVGTAPLECPEPPPARLIRP